MNLEISSIWSPNFNGKFPNDVNDFDVYVQLRLVEKGTDDGEVFSLRVCSSSALGRTESGKFIEATLCLDQFSWSVVRKRIEKLLMQVDSCKDWKCVIEKLSGYLDYAD